ncbi:MAG: nitroreductase/quinone reductase family protein [Dermatophilaceae bacterium]|nr:nitroreductase/quinone reductase family protein [Intrasporangiaceae bacterium]
MTDARPAVERVYPPKALYGVINPMLTAALSSRRWSKRVGERLLLLHVTGRKTGREFTIPVGHRPAPDGGRVVLTGAPWRVNLRGREEVEVTYRGERRPARAQLVEDPAAVAQVYRELIEEIGPDKAGRQMGIRINVDRVPTLEELEEAVRRDNLAVIHLNLEG